MTGVGDDVGERGGAFSLFEIGFELVEADVVLRALGTVGQRVEEDDRVAPGYVGVARQRGLAGVGGAERWVATAGRLAAGDAVADVLDVGLPSQVFLDQLRGQGRGGRRVDAAAAFDLTFGRERARGYVGVSRAVGGRLRRRPLAAEQGDLVGQVPLGDRVVVGEQLAFLGQGPRQVRRGGGLTERFLEAVFAEHDQEQVLDRRQRFFFRQFRRQFRLDRLFGGRFFGQGNRRREGRGGGRQDRCGFGRRRRFDGFGRFLRRRRRRGGFFQNDRGESGALGDLAGRRTEQDTERQHPHHRHRGGPGRGHEAALEALVALAGDRGAAVDAALTGRPVLGLVFDAGGSHAYISVSPHGVAEL